MEMLNRLKSVGNATVYAAEQLSAFRENVATTTESIKDMAHLMGLAYIHEGKDFV